MEEWVDGGCGGAHCGVTGLDARGSWSSWNPGVRGEMGSADRLRRV